MDDALLVRVLDSLADEDEKPQPLLGGKLVLVTVLRDLDPPDQFHDEVRPAGVGCAGIKNLGDVRMVHHRKRLALGLEPGHDLPAAYEVDGLK